MVDRGQGLDERQEGSEDADTRAMPTEYTFFDAAGHEQVFRLRADRLGAWYWNMLIRADWQGLYATRSQALAAVEDWLDTHP